MPVDPILSEVVRLPNLQPNCPRRRFLPLARSGLVAVETVPAHSLARLGSQFGVHLPPGVCRGLPSPSTPRTPSLIAIFQPQSRFGGDISVSECQTTAIRHLFRRVLATWGGTLYASQPVSKAGLGASFSAPPGVERRRKEVLAHCHLQLERRAQITATHLVVD